MNYSTTEFKVLVIGDIVGRPGRNILKYNLKKIIHNEKVNFVIANGENAAGGFGLTPKIAKELFSCGVDVITSGNHIWKNKSIFEIIDKEEKILRPLNYPDGLPGNGYGIYEKDGLKVLVVNLLGRLNLLEVDCPFHKIDELLKKVKNKFDISIVDFHAETTSEKVAMGWYLDGRVNVVVGTHTHIQTADERILPNGTAYITDIGMTGSVDSIIGMDKTNIIQHFLTRMPIKFKIAKNNVMIHGVTIILDKKKKQSKYIRRVKFKDGDMSVS